MGVNKYTIEINNALLGKRFGKLIVLEQVESYRHTDTFGNLTCRSKFKCICDCGKETIVEGTKLRRKKVIRCSDCAYRSRPQSTERYTNEERLYRLTIVQRCKNSKGRIENLLSFEDFCKLIKNNCYYCGEPPRRLDYLNQNRVVLRGELYANGIDRVNSSGNYCPENCVACCGKCNVMKMDLTFEEFKNQIKILYEKWIKQEEIMEIK